MKRIILAILNKILIAGITCKEKGYSRGVEKGCYGYPVFLSERR